MTFNNKGRIRPAAGPEGHTHSIYQLNDIAASGIDFQSFVSNKGVWVPQTIAPYAMVSGRSAVTISLGSPWSTGTTTITFSDSPWNGKFTVTPTVFVTPVATGITAPMTAQYTANTTQLTIRLNYYGSINTTVTVSWLAIQMQSNSAYGAVSLDPSVL